ncbi:Gamma-tubulin complex component 2 [Halocaridina rubra]|uniref:Gamma-tubulin complex component n=1 Tax=Halocaridina rubra TaxID=373956 RepID=A0AAN8XSL7_HALRR
MDKFAMLACITKDLSKSGARGSAVLNLLHDRMLNLAECNPFKNVMMELTKAAADPYMSMLYEWLNRGIIDDPYEEFMVVDTKTGITDEYWEKRYAIIPQSVPTFLKMHENVILLTGKYLNVIRQSGQEVRSPEQQKPIFSTTEASYSEVIERTYNFPSKKLFELFMDEKNLMGRLRSVKRFFLLDEGDFVLQLISKCEEELKKKIDVRPKCLQMLFKLALEDSSANNDIYKDDIICTLQPMTLMSQVQRILSNETEEDRLQISGLQGFTLGYRDRWPVSLVLDSKNIPCYQIIFRHLFFCKYVEKLLCRVWIRDKVMKSFPPSASHTCSSAFVLRHCMLNFIQNIEYYMMFDVIESNWQTFCNKIQMASVVLWYF